MSLILGIIAVVLFLLAGLDSVDWVDVANTEACVFFGLMFFAAAVVLPLPPLRR